MRETTEDEFGHSPRAKQKKQNASLSVNNSECPEDIRSTTDIQFHGLLINDYYSGVINSVIVRKLVKDVRNRRKMPVSCDAEDWSTAIFEGLTSMADPKNSYSLMVLMPPKGAFCPGFPPSANDVVLGRPLIIVQTLIN